METPSNRLVKAIRLAEGGRGIVERRDLVELGIPSRTITRMIQTQRLFELFPSVYRFGGAPVQWEDRLAAAVKWGGNGAVASYRSAARLHGLSIRSDVIEITVPRRNRKPEGIIIHSGRTDPLDVVVLRGIPVTSIPRTLLTLQAVVPTSLLESLLDESLIRHKTTVPALVDVLLRAGGKGNKGVGAFRRLLTQRIELPDAIRTELELRLHALFLRHRLPPPSLQYPIRIAGETFRPDFCYPDLKIVIEGDSHQFHLSRQQREADLDRQNLLVLQGWVVLRFTWEMVTRHPKLVAESIRSAIASQTVALASNLSTIRPHMA